MRILQIYELPPHGDTGTGGIEVAIMETSRQLVSLGHEVSILTGAKDKAGTITIDGVRIISVDMMGIMEKTWRGAKLSFARQLFFPLAVFFNRSNIPKMDVYHGHIYTSGMVAAYLAHRHHGVAINTIHGSYYPMWHELTNPIAATFYRTAERILAPMLAKICQLQLHTGDYFARQVLEWGASEHKVKTIHNGVDTERFKPRNTGMPENLCIPDRSPVIITARRLVKKNGVEYLIRAVGHVLKEEDCHLVIIGDGEEAESLRALVQELDIGRHVHFMGFIPHDKLAPYLNIADIAVVPSLMEASSLFMLEAMAMGKPVIATNAGGLPEVLDPSIGMLVEIMDEKGLALAILELIRDEGKRVELGKHARRCVEDRQSWYAVTRRMESEYERCLKELHK